jgi:hypothetical protein
VVLSIKYFSGSQTVLHTADTFSIDIVRKTNTGPRNMGQDRTIKRIYKNFAPKTHIDKDDYQKLLRVLEKYTHTLCTQPVKIIA